ncbi:hypothetical protein AXG93_1162s1050 [Marchantia polymorpha subsp. ruderalis]|uniref:Uncharacterized protein n=1 Tax=Marchantia polymorpha subsp. ruderalis TaxID=1480154 RepID=A0A176WQ55_MARPO|nr:hypothetical protein AXG93_1162s1050 [Marchantia polymorpha subsp. ruderalis]
MAEDACSTASEMCSKSENEERMAHQNCCSEIMFSRAPSKLRRDTLRVAHSCSGGLVVKMLSQGKERSQPTSSNLLERELSSLARDVGLRRTQLLLKLELQVLLLLDQVQQASDLPTGAPNHIETRTSYNLKVETPILLVSARPARAHSSGAAHGFAPALA